MTENESGPVTRWWNRLRSEWTGARTDLESVPEPEADPPVYRVARLVRTVSPETRIGEAMEYLRTGPYPVVPVTQNGELRGVLTEAVLVAAFLSSAGEERRRVRELAVRDLMDPPADILTLHVRASEAALRMDTAGTEVLPVADYQGQFAGLVSRSDLAQELARPFIPPMIGGMATPIGVYLTAGGTAGGVGTGALVLTGLVMSTAYIVAALVALPLAGLISFVPQAGQATVLALVQSVVQLGLFLGFVRFSPMSGYHAAEHQTVHAVERGEPLLVSIVRQMPRVHPRCGTNLVAGGTLFWTVGAGLEPWLGEFAYLVSGLLALTYWRRFGSWLQEHMTTRPATDTQLESGIRAAREVLDRYQSLAYTPVSPLGRLWRMGFLQILMGFSIGFGLAYLVTLLFPAGTGPLRTALMSVW